MRFDACAHKKGYDLTAATHRLRKALILHLTGVFRQTEPWIVLKTSRSESCSRRKVTFRFCARDLLMASDSCWNFFTNSSKRSWQSRSRARSAGDAPCCKAYFSNNQMILDPSTRALRLCKKRGRRSGMVNHANVSSCIKNSDSDEIVPVSLLYERSFLNRRNRRVIVSSFHRV